MTDGTEPTTPETTPEVPPATPVAPATEPEKKADKEKAPTSLIERFCKASGYKKSDVLDSSEDTKTVVTSNGGKYRINKKGDLVHLSGPVAPNSVEVKE